MDRKEAFDYIKVAAHERIRASCKHCLDNEYDIESVKDDIEYYEDVMKYIEENLK
jgi:hypothetical protein